MSGFFRNKFTFRKEEMHSFLLLTQIGLITCGEPNVILLTFKTTEKESRTMFVQLSFSL